MSFYVPETCRNEQYVSTKNKDFGGWNFDLSFVTNFWLLDNCFLFLSYKNNFLQFCSR